MNILHYHFDTDDRGIDDERSCEDDADRCERRAPRGQRHRPGRKSRGPVGGSQRRGHSGPVLGSSDRREPRSWFETGRVVRVRQSGDHRVLREVPAANPPSPRRTRLGVVARWYGVFCFQ